MKKTFNIAISCIGSGVGQSVINSCRLSKLPLKTIGFGTNPLAYGLYDCDSYIYAPSIYSSGYVAQFIELAKQQEIDLVIPGMDDEAHFFSKNLDKFEDAGLRVIAAGEEILNWCRDKELMSNDLNAIADIFVKSFDKENIQDAISSGVASFPLIAKPRSGFASRGIEIILSQSDLERIEDFHIVQELAIPRKQDPDHEYYMNQLAKRINPQVSEISIQIVADKNGDLMGRMMSYNKLNNGVPIEIIPYNNESIWAEIEKLYPTFKLKGLRGPLNLQGRLTDNGLKLFEMNARFTGITGLRAYMGFNEVEACIKNWLDIPCLHNSLSFSYHQFGVRQTADKAISFDRNASVKEIYNRLHMQDQKKDGQIIMLTGATGYLGQNLISEICESNASDTVIALVRNKERARHLLKGLNISIINEQDLANGDFSLGHVDVLIHAAFARPHCSNDEIASSLVFTSDLLDMAVKSQVPNIINISSQSVYGQFCTPPWNETSSVSPTTPYGMAKLATELLLQSNATRHPHINFTSLRIGALSGGASGLIDVDLLSKLTKRALAGEDLEIIGGNQTVERLDIRDAVSSIMAVISKTNLRWAPVYAVGSGMRMNIVDVASIVAKSVGEANSTKPVAVKVQKQDIEQHFGLESVKFSKDFDWSPKHSIQDIVDSLIAYYSIK